MNVWLGLIGASGYVFLVIGVAEALRRWCGLGTEFTRKVVHIGVGMLIWLVPFLFETATPFIATALLFSVLTLADNWLHLFPSMASKDDDSNLGTFYFPLAAAAVAWIFWETPAIMVAALMPLTWGDGMAEVIGRRFGRNKFTVFGHTRSLEGSLAFFVFGSLAAILALSLMPNPFSIALGSVIAAALFTLALTTLVEAVSVAGLDNLTITAAAMLVLSLWPF